MVSWGRRKSATRENSMVIYTISVLLLRRRNPKRRNVYAQPRPRNHRSLRRRKTGRRRQSRQCHRPHPSRIGTRSLTSPATRSPCPPKAKTATDRRVLDIFDFVAAIRRVYPLSIRNRNSRFLSSASLIHSFVHLIPAITFRL